MSLQGWTSTPFSSQGPRAHPCTAGAPLPHRQLTRWAWSGPGAALGTKVAWRTEVSCDPISGVWDSCCLSAMEPCPARPRHSHQTRQEAVRACRREGKTGSPVMGRGEIGDPPPHPSQQICIAVYGQSIPIQARPEFCPPRSERMWPNMAVVGYVPVPLPGSQSVQSDCWTPPLCGL